MSRRVSHFGITKRVASALLGLSLWVAAGTSAVAQPAELRGGWSPGLPYQVEMANAAGEPKLTGLDIEIMKALSREAGFRVVFEEIPWEENLQAVREGRLDFAMAATPVDERHEWAWFSQPYRKEALVIFTRRGEAYKWRAATALEGLERILVGGGRVGIIRGYYQGPEATELLAREEYAEQLLAVDDESSLLDVLLSGRVDAIVGDRLAMASSAWRVDALASIDMLSGILYETPLCLMFSKSSTSPEIVQAYDKALEGMRASGQLDLISRHYLVPQMLFITMKTVWFRAFDIIGTIAFAISGVLIARRERYDIIGACVLAALPAVGGGVMRDLISARSPIGIVQTPTLLLLVLGTVLTGTLFFWLHDLLFNKEIGLSPSTEKFRWASSRGALAVFDAIGLATFTIIGVMVAVEQRCEPLWLWGPVMGALTASGGGVLRDVLRSQSDIPTLKGSIYPEIAIVWGLLYSLMIMFRGPDLTLREVLILTTTILLAIFFTRILVVHFGLKSLYLGRFRSKASCEQNR